MPNCSSRSCIVAPVLQHLQQPSSTRTTFVNESSAVATPEAPAATAVHDHTAARAWPKRVSDIHAAATFKDYYYYY